MVINAVTVCFLLGIVQVFAMQLHVESLGEFHGYISTPNYPNNYTNNYEGIWELNLPVLDQTYTLVLTIDEMDIEGSLQHCFDYIKVIHQKYCGTSARIITVPGIEGGLIIEFHTDSSETRKGFKAHYEFIQQ